MLCFCAVGVADGLVAVLTSCNVEAESDGTACASEKLGHWMFFEGLLMIPGAHRQNSTSDDERRFFEQLAFNEKMAELGRLSTGIVHELNTPLSVIVSAAQMILREDELSEFVRELVERINTEAQRLSQLTRGVTTFARREENPSGETDLNSVIREVGGLLKYEAQKRSILVVEELDYRLPSVRGDANRFKQIFMNLMVNALQAMDSGGRLVVTTSRDMDGAVRVQVADTGEGIPAAALESVFEPFFTTKKPGEGTGLGLYVTRMLVDSLDGKVSISSTVGEGTTFHLQFPAVG